MLVLATACSGAGSAPAQPTTAAKPTTAATKPAAPDSTPAPAAAAAGTAPILATLSGPEKERVAGLIAQAKTEGGLEWITTVVTASKDPLLTEFKKQYDLPDLKINFENIQTSQITSRIQGEASSRKITTDIIGLDGAASFFSTLKDAGALQQYSSPELSAYQGSEKYVSDDFGYWVSPFALMYLPVYDPKVVPNGITSWNDLLDPKFKGKISLPGVLSSESALYT